MPVENPALKALNLVDEKGNALTVRFTDRPMNRAGMAVVSHFTGEKFKSIMMRLLALHDIYEHPKLSQWVRKDSDGRTELAESILAAAARAALTRTTGFNPDEMAKLALEYEKENDLVDGVPS